MLWISIRFSTLKLKGIARFHRGNHGFDSCSVLSTDHVTRRNNYVINLIIIHHMDPPFWDHIRCVDMFINVF